MSARRGTAGGGGDSDWRLGYASQRRQTLDASGRDRNQSPMWSGRPDAAQPGTTAAACWTLSVGAHGPVRKLSRRTAWW